MAAVPAAQRDCQRGYDDLIGTLRSMGFLSNDEKNEPPAQSLTFLGGGLDTNTEGTGRCSKYIDEEKRQRVLSRCTEMAQTRSRVRVSDLMSLLGLLMFCAGIVQGTRLYLRSGFDLIKGRRKRDFVQLTRAFRFNMTYVARLFTLATPRTMMQKRPLTTVFGSWDASTSWGMGGFLDGKWYSEQWSTFLARRGAPAFYPKEGTPSFHINYLELFAGYWFLKLWGESLRGFTVVCHTDNTATEGMLKRMWGTSTFIPLLKEIQALLVKYDIALSPQRIDTKSNILSDCLSRGAMGEYGVELRKWSNVSLTDKDREDWQMATAVVAELDEEYGPFDVDGCTDQYRTNAHFAKSWNAEDDCEKQQWQGLNVFCNGPFSRLLQILRHAAECKRAQPVGTAALFIVPCWPTEAFYQYALGHPKMFRVVQRWPAGTPLFTAPVPAQLGGGRIYNGPTRWPVVALRMGPGADCAT